MATTTKPVSIDAYIATFPADIGETLEELRALIHTIVPDVQERISYGMPTFELDGKYLVYFAGWKEHVGFYPVTGAVERELGKELEPFRTGKGTIQFPLGEPMPLDLIRRIVEVRVRELTGQSG
jgi:uncharacterized protein YdhG (YjbR/CyaY superfamily)